MAVNGEAGDNVEGEFVLLHDVDDLGAGLDERVECAVCLEPVAQRCVWLAERDHAQTLVDPAVVVSSRYSAGAV